MRTRLFILLAVLTAWSAGAQTRSSERFFPAEELTTVGVYYYPEHWPETQWKRDLKQIRELGFEFVHYAEFAWGQLEPADGVYDFGWLDRAVQYAKEEGLKIIMCTSTATPPVWLVRKHPEICTLNENGTREAHGARQHPSPSSGLYREYALRMIDKLAERYGSDPMIIGWQLDNEPKVVYDFNPAAQERFRGWLRVRYHNDIKALNQAWGTAFWSQAYRDFEEIEIPRMSQYFMNNHQVLDYKRFATDEIASFLDEQARAIRRHSQPSQWITTNYIPSYGNGHLRKSDELDFHSYTRYMVYGDKTGIGRKGYRLGDVERIALANDFFRPIDGIYGVMELQPGQVNWGQINPQPLPGAVRLWLWHVFGGGSKFTCTYRYRQPVYGTELYHYGIVGTDGVTVTPGGREFAQFIQEIDLLRKAYDPDAPKNEAYEKRRTAILFNHENMWEMDRNRQNRQWNSERHLTKYYDALKRFGAPVDVVDERADFSIYPVLIAPSYQQIDEELVARWMEYVENGGNLVLTARTGHKTRNGHLFEAEFAAPIYSLIGAKIDFYDLLLPETPDTIRFDNKPYTWTNWGEILNPQPGTEIWGTYEGDYYTGRPGVIFRKLGKGTVTYVGVDSRNGDLEEAVLEKLYDRLKIGIEHLPVGVHIEYRDGFGIAVNYSDKTEKLPLSPDTQFLIGSSDIPTAGVSVFRIK